MRRKFSRLPVDGFDADTLNDAAKVVLDKNAPTNARTGRVQRPGLVDGRYELEGMISHGGMGRVFRARHRDLGKRVAIKLVLDGYKDQPEFREVFFREARLASSLDHPNIVSVTDFGLDEGLGYFVVMELLEGESMRDWLDRGPKLRRVFELFDDAVEAVRYIHKRGIVHCDLKPDNIFLARTESGPVQVKLLDFGLSWRRETVPDIAVGGTPPYLAPERIKGSPPTPSCDVYSLGIILYEAIAGQLPWKAENVIQMIGKQIHGPDPSPPSKFSSETIDPRVDDLVMRSIHKDPAKRPQSVEAFHYELRTLMSMMGIDTRRKGRRQQASAKRIAALEEVAKAARTISEKGMPHGADSAYWDAVTAIDQALARLDSGDLDA